MNQRIALSLAAAAVLAGGCQTQPTPAELFAQLDAHSFVRNAAKNPQIDVNVNILKCIDGSTDADVIQTQTRARTCPFASNPEFDDTDVTCAELNDDGDLVAAEANKITWRSTSGLRFRLVWKEQDELKNPLKNCGKNFKTRETCTLPAKKATTVSYLDYGIEIDDSIGAEAVKCERDPRIYMMR